MGAQQIARGPEAVRLVRDLGNSPRAVEMRTPTGLVSIPPGTCDLQQGMVIVGRVGPHVLYIQRSILYRSEIARFIQGYNLGQIANSIYRSTRWIIPATQIMLAATMGFSLGAIGVIGTVASITVVVAKVTVFRQTHQFQVDQAIRHIGTIVRILRWMSSHCPITYEKLGTAVGPATWSLLLSAVRGASAADIIFIVGRFFGGLWASAGATAFGTLLRITINVVGAVAARAPGAVARGAGGDNLREQADRLIQGLQQSQVQISPTDADRIRNEFQQHPEVVRQLSDLRQAIQQATPVLQALSDAFRLEALPQIQQASP